MEVTRELSLAKVYAGPAPGPRPPSPDVEIVTPARVTTINHDDHSRGLAQSNLHHTPKAGTISKFFGNSKFPDGFAVMQRQRLLPFGKKKQRTGSKRKASKRRNNDSDDSNDEPTIPSFSDVGFTQVPGADEDDSMIDSDADADGKMPAGPTKREMELQAMMESLQEKHKQLAMMIEGMSVPGSDAATPASLPPKSPAKSPPKSPPKLPSTGSEDPIVVASPVVQVPAEIAAKNNDLTQASADAATDTAVIHTQSQSQSQSQQSSDSEYDADVVAELNSDKGERRTLPTIPRPKPSPKKGNDRRTHRLGALQLPARYVAHDLEWTAYMPNHDVNLYFGSIIGIC